MLLVALRVAIGWHFFSEGVSHKNDPSWSSEAFLRQAKGPLAGQFKSRAPGFHQYDLLVPVPLDEIEPEPLPNEGDPVAAPKQQAAADHEPAEQEQPAKASDSRVYGQWYRAIIQDWDARSGELANFYGFSDEQKKKVREALDRYDESLGKVLKDYEPDIAYYRRQMARNRALAETPGAAEIPHIQDRTSSRNRDPIGEPSIFIDSRPSDWIDSIQSLENAFEREVLALRTDDQLELGPPPAATTPLEQIDTVVTWILIIGGGCLLIGLFTRLSAVVLAVFLGSVILSQPFWVAGAAPTYFQVVEFLALLTLAATHVGRWAGIDFFVHHLITRPLFGGRSTGDSSAGN